MATDTDETTFVASDLIGSAGVGSEAERLIATLAYHVPPELEAVQLRRINESLTQQAFGTGTSAADASDADQKRWKTATANVAKIAGADRVEQVVVRGGERNPDDAWVSYVFLDGRGVDVKGAFPYTDLERGTSDQHASQRDSVMRSPAARDHAAAAAKADNVTPAASSGDPIADYEEMRAPDVIAYLEAHPERAATIKALETATRGDDARKTILNWEPPKTDEGDSDPGDPPATPPNA